MNPHLTLPASVAPTLAAPEASPRRERRYGAPQRRRGEHGERNRLSLALAHFLRIAERRGAFGFALPDVTPIRATGGDDSTLKNTFDRHQRSRISPTVDLHMTIAVRDQATT